jgi:hypothetical protein
MSLQKFFEFFTQTDAKQRAAKKDAIAGLLKSLNSQGPEIYISSLKAHTTVINLTKEAIILENLYQDLVGPHSGFINPTVRAAYIERVHDWQSKGVLNEEPLFTLDQIDKFQTGGIFGPN